MVSKENATHYVAELTVGLNAGEVKLSEITMESCIARVNYTVRPYQQGVLQIHSHQGGERISSFKAARVLVESINQRVGEVGAFYVKLTFKGMVSASQGIVQVLHSQIQAPAPVQSVEP